MNSWKGVKVNQEPITAGEIEYLRIRLQRETDYIEAAKLQKELIEKEALYDEQFRKRLEEIENDGQGLVGSR